MAGVLSRLEILLHANTANFRRNMRRAADDARSSMGDIQNKAATAAFGVASLAVGGLAAAIVPVQRQFDIMNGQLVTATGSTENAAHAMAALNKFAAQTPYDLEQSVIGFTKLVNLGLTPSERALTSYGNAASAMGKSMEQMIEAVADASTFQFTKLVNLGLTPSERALTSYGNAASAMGKSMEQMIEAVADASTFQFTRLLDFGIKARQETDSVVFTFQGAEKKVGKSAAEIEAYLMSIGEVEFASAMDAQMDTLNGRMEQSTLAMNDLKLAIAQSGIGDIMKEAVEGANASLEGMTAFIRY